jgi:hypothetical protein
MTLTLNSKGIIIMNGEKVFDMLNKMSADERKQSEFYYIADINTVKMVIDDIIFDISTSYPFTEEEIRNVIKDIFPVKEVFEILSDSCVSALDNDGFQDGYEMFMGELYNRLEKKVNNALRANGFNIADN